MVNISDLVMVNVVHMLEAMDIGNINLLSIIKVFQVSPLLRTAISAITQQRRPFPWHLASVVILVLLIMLNIFLNLFQESS